MISAMWVLLSGALVAVLVSGVGLPGLMLGWSVGLAAAASARPRHGLAAALIAGGACLVAVWAPSPEARWVSPWGVLAPTLGAALGALAGLRGSGWATRPPRSLGVRGAVAGLVVALGCGAGAVWVPWDAWVWGVVPASVLGVGLSAWALTGSLDLGLWVGGCTALGGGACVGWWGWWGLSEAGASAAPVACAWAGVQASGRVSAHLDRLRTGRAVGTPRAWDVALWAPCAAAAVVAWRTGAEWAVALAVGAPVAGVVAWWAAEVSAVALIRPHGAPGWRELWTTAWVLRHLVGGGLVYLLTRAWRLKGDAARHDAQLEIQRLSLGLEHHLPSGVRDRVPYDPSVWETPGVLVANHESLYDLMAVMALPIRCVVLVKRWVWKTPVMGPMVRRAGHILIEGEAEDVLRQARAAIDDGAWVVVFPEGRRSRSGEIARFKNGAFAIARALDVSVVPLALVNARASVRAGTWWVEEHRARSVVLERSHPRDFPDPVGDRRMAREVRARIVAACRARWLETVRWPKWHVPLAGRYRYLGPVVRWYAASKLRRDPLAAALPEHHPAEGSVVVVGCGYGVLLTRLATSDPGREVVGLETDPRKVGVARAATRDLAGVEIREGAARDPGVWGTQGEVGCVWLVDVLHYWPDAEQRVLLRRAREALGQEGRLWVREGCGGAVVTGEAAAGRIGFTRLPGALNFRTREEWLGLLREEGFTVEWEAPDLGALSNVLWSCRAGEASDVDRGT